MSLLTELDAFFTDHRQCGDLDAGVERARRLDRLPVRREDRAEGHRGRRVRAVVH
jgi:hypothetical protein